MEASEINAELDRGATFLRSGLQWPAIEEGLRVIEVWEQRLAASDDQDLVSIADNLAELRAQLLAGNFDPANLGRLLTTLGDQTREVAESETGAPVSERLSSLADLLNDRGNELIEA